MPGFLTRGTQRYTFRVPKPRSRTSSLQGAYEAARRANERRYQEILGGYGQRYEDVMGALQGYGGQARADILQRGESMKAGALQDLVSRGLAGTTILPTVRAGIERQTAGNLARQAETMGMSVAGMMAQLSGQRLGFMERREDMYPNLGMYYGMLQNYGRYGGGQSQPSRYMLGAQPGGGWSRRSY